LLQWFIFTDSMIRYFLLFVALYVGYKLIFDLIIPVFRASRQVHRQFRNMNEQMRQQHQQANTAQNGWQGNTHEPQKTTSSTKPEAGDYIDFEEIK